MTVLNCVRFTTRCVTGWFIGQSSDAKTSISFSAKLVICIGWVESSHFRWSRQEEEDDKRHSTVEIAHLHFQKRSLSKDKPVKKINTFFITTHTHPQTHRPLHFKMVSNHAITASPKLPFEPKTTIIYDLQPSKKHISLHISYQVVNIRNVGHDVIHQSLAPISGLTGCFGQRAVALSSKRRSISEPISLRLIGSVGKPT